MTPDPQPGTFEIHVSDTRSRARAGLLYTAHGTVETPVFMPVGTQATVKALEPRDLRVVPGARGGGGVRPLRGGGPGQVSFFLLLPSARQTESSTC